MSKLLIVDDEEDVREFAKSFFKKRGVEVLTASGGKDALVIIAQESPDLVLLDVRMEQMTGVEVLKELRED
ncbi:MAG: response regulator, partial [Candidatus Omnitrophica bacterium]|nr:response regulator [Candidatus Omnitrophota bacterium]